ncbi:hypothetical protein BGZ80_000487 [Entomortierella chlamydospora]|uniref:DNA polymerase delta subunit 3 n=1 Tax=Entomortierella chlamydospora TaxID=101097 RepID=A0A9P6N3E5_9FUNG|nr:hypothetical protein BGZ80_000487 [Entomortierella chlamydospora]
MSADIENQTMDLLATTVEDEKKNAYGNLPVDNGKGESAWNVLLGAPGPTNWKSDYFTHQSRRPSRVVHNRSVVVSKSNAEAAAPVAKSAPAQANKSTPAPSTATPATTPSATTSISSNIKSKPAAAASKASVMSFFGKAATAAPKSTASSTTTATSSTPSTKSSTLNFKPTAQKRKSDLMSTSNNINNNGRSDSRERVEEDDSDEEVDSEEERDRRLALSSRLDQDQGDVTESKINGRKAPSPSESATLDVNAIKKRQRNARLLAVDDDDEADDEHFVTQKLITEDDGSNEEDDESVETMSKEALIALNKEKERQRLALENMMLAPDEDSPMIDVEALDPPNEPSAPTGHAGTAATNQGTTPGRRRGVRAVTKRKTSRNDRGYMVTEDVVEMESFSEDDVPAPAPAPVRTEKTEPLKTKQESGASKKKAGSGNQSLLNFFSKK